MITKALDKKIGFLVEQKLNELLGDPDSFLSLNKQFVRKLKARMGKSSQLVQHDQVKKKYGLG